MLYSDDDTMCLIYNPFDNRIYTYSEVNRILTLIKGELDTFFNLPKFGCTTVIDIRTNTNCIYFANYNSIVILEGNSYMLEFIQVDRKIMGGTIIFQIIINQTSRRVHIINHGLNLKFIMVLQDTEKLIRSLRCICSISDLFIYDSYSDKQVAEKHLEDVYRKSISFLLGGVKIYVLLKYRNYLRIYAVIAVIENIITFVSLGVEYSSIVVCSKDDSKIYVNNSKTNDVCIIDGIHNSLIKNVEVGQNPSELDIAPYDEKVYVCNINGYILSNIDTSSMKKSSTIPDNNTPWSITMNNLGTKAYVTNSDSNNISVFDTRTDTVVNSISVASMTQWPERSLAGNKLFISNSGEEHS